MESTSEESIDHLVFCAKLHPRFGKKLRECVTFGGIGTLEEELQWVSKHNKHNKVRLTLRGNRNPGAKHKLRWSQQTNTI